VRREIVQSLVESLSENQTRDGLRKLIHWTIKKGVKSQVLNGLGERINRHVETKSEVGERRGEGFDRPVEWAIKREKNEEGGKVDNRCVELVPKREVT
jgi:hypothetical protein